MNKAYRSVWNESTGSWVAVQEDASARGKKSSARGSRVTVAVVGVGSALAASGAFAQSVGSGGLELCAANSATAGYALGYQTNTTSLSCNTGVSGSSPAFAFSLNNAAANNGGNGFSMSTARVTGYANGLLELEGVGNISMLNTVTMNGNKITNLAAGTVSNASMDGVNGSQLYGLASSTASALGGGTAVNPNGSISAPVYTVAGATYNSVGSALEAINETSGVNSVQYDTSAHDSVTLGGADSTAPVALHNVADGVVAAGSTDAVNGGQLYGVSENITNVNSDLTKIHNTLNTAGWGAQASSSDPAGYTYGGFIVDANGNVSNPAVLYVPNTVGTANAQIVLDPGQGNSAYFVNGDRSAGYLPAGTIISNVHDGIQATDAANVGQVADMIASAAAGGGGSAPQMLMARTMLGASSGSGVDTSGLTNTYNTAAYYSQVAGLANNAGTTPPSDMAHARGAGSIAIGSSALTTGTAGTAMGVEAYTSANDAVALGSGSVANQANTVSVGSDGTGSYTAMYPNGQSYTIKNPANTRRIVNMAAGQADTDAVNVSQLKGVTTALGGGAAVNSDGSIAAPSYVVGSGTYSDVGSALQAVDNDAQAGSSNAVKYDTSAHTTVTFGNAGTPVALKNVAAGDISNASSTDAVNGGQLYATNQNVSDLAGTVTNIAGDITNINGQLADAVSYDTSAHDSVTLGGTDASTPVALHNVANATSNNDAVNLAQLEAAGLNVDTSGNVTNSFVAYDDSSKGSVTFGGVGSSTPVALHNVAAGNLSATSTDAVNGGQLYATNQNVSDLAGTVTNIAGDITNINGQLADAVSYDTSAHDSVTLGGTDASTPVALHNVANATSNNDAVNLAQLEAAGLNVDTSGNVTNSFVAYDDSSKGSVTFGGVGSSTPVALHNVAAGNLSATSTDAVNGGQLYATNQNVSDLAGTVTNIAGDITNINGQLADAVSYDTSAHDSVTLGGTDASTPVALHNVANATSNNDAVNLAQLEAAGLNVDTSGNVTNSFVAYDDSSKGSVTFGGVGSSTPVALHNVAAGNLSATSTDAVNGGQLYATNQNVSDLAGTVTNIAGDITNINGQLADAVSYDTSAHDSVTLGGTDASTPVALHNVANATSNNDAVNLAQLEAAGLNVDTSGNVTNSFVAYDDSSKGSVTFGGVGSSTPVALHNVAAGNLSATSTDAVNGGQLYATNQNVSDLAGTVTNIAGDITNINGQLADAVSYDTSAHDSVTLGGTDASTPVALHNVANATSNNDAVNLAQLEAAGLNVDTSGNVTNSFVAYDDSSKGSVTFGGVGSSTPVALHNVANGLGSNDAVNVAQLNSAGFALDSSGAVLNKAVTYDAGSIASGSPTITLDPGTGNSRYFRNSNRQDGYLPAGTVISNVAAGLQDTDAANVGQVADLINSSTGNGGGQPSLMASAMLGASSGSGVDTSGLTNTYNTAAYYSQVAGLANNAGTTPPSDMAHARGAGSIAIGSNALTTGTAGTAMGVEAYTSANDAVALGSGSVANQANTVSVGSDGTGSYTAMYPNGQSYTIQNAANTRRIVNMAAGQADTDAVNVSQLKGVTTALGGGAAVNSDGSIAAPSYVVGKGTYSDVGSALAAVEASAGAGGADAVVYDTSAHKAVTLGGAGSTTPVALHNVAQGNLSATSTDAVNGAQLYATNQNVSNLAGSVTNLAGDITNINGQLADAVSYDTSAHDSVTLGGTDASTPVALHNVANATSTNDAVNLAQLEAAGLNVDTSGNVTNSFVAYDDSSKGSVTFGGVGSSTPVALHNVAQGAVSLTSNDAVNGSQLYGLASSTAQALGGQASVQNGTVTAPSYVLGTSTYNNVGSALDAVMAQAQTGNTNGVAYDTSVHDSVTFGGVGSTTPVALHNVANATSTNDAVNLAQLEAAGLNVDTSGNVTNSFVAYDDSSKGSVTFGGVGSSTPVALHNVAQGAVSLTSNDAVNGSQLYGLASSTAQALGGQASVQNGTVTAPSYVLGTSTYNNVGSALDAVMAQAKTGNTDGVAYDTSVHDSVTFGGVGSTTPVALHNVANATSTNDAVNLAQLQAAGLNVDTSGNVTNSFVAYDNTSKSQITLGGAGGTVITNVKSGSVTASSMDAVNGSQLYSLQQEINAGSIGLVQQDATTGAITVGANTNGSVVNFAGTSGPRTLTGIASGAVNASSVDAVNGTQLYNTAQSTASALGGGSTVAPDGTVTAPSYNVGGSTFNNVGGALTNLDGRVTNIENTVTNIAGTVANAVQYDSSAHDQVTLGGSGATSTVKLTNLSDADLTATSTDAVTGEQLYATNQQVAGLGQAIQNINVTGSQYMSTNTTSGPASATGSNSIAAGGGATASGANSTAMGDKAAATGNNSVALGANSIADQDNTVSVGSAGNERRMTNVADGVNATDAVNMGQLQSGMNSLQSGMTSLARNAYGGVAAATALTMIPDVDQGKTIAVGVGTANFKGYQAAALGASARITQNLKVKLGAGYAAGSGTTYGGGMAYQW